MLTRRLRWVLTLVLTALAVAALPPPGQASQQYGNLTVLAFDDFNGRRIRDVCFTVTEPGTSTVVEYFDDGVNYGYPLGTYDVLVEDCAEYPEAERRLPGSHLHDRLGLVARRIAY